MFLSLIYAALMMTEVAQDGNQPFVPSALIGTSASGAMGVRQVAAAHNRGVRVLSLSLGGGYGSASSFLANGDRAQLQTQAVRVGFSLTSRWEFILGEITRGASDSAVDGGTAASWTLVQLSGAYSHAFADAWHVGAALRLDLPAKSSGLGMAFSNIGGEVQLRGSWRPSSLVETSVNVGYLVDRSQSLFSAAAQSVQRLALGSAGGSRVTWGIGANAWLDPSAWLIVGGLAEFSGQWAPGADGGGAPVTASLGVRLMPRAFPLAELTAGVDLRVAGAPHTNDFYAGALPWYFFAQLAVHIAPFEPRQATEPNRISDAPPAPAAEVPAATESQQPLGQSLRGESIAEVPHEMVVSGSVLTAHGRPIIGSRITLSGYPEVLLTTDFQTGAFRTLPFACESNQTLYLTATTPRGWTASGAIPCKERYVSIILVPRPPGVALGSVSFSVTGQNWQLPERGQVVCEGVPASPFAIEPGKALRIELPTRSYTCEIKAPNSISQRHTFVIRSNETQVFNIDLAPLPTRVSPRTAP